MVGHYVTARMVANAANGNPLTDAQVKTAVVTANKKDIDGGVVYPADLALPQTIPRGKTNYLGLTEGSYRKHLSTLSVIGAGGQSRNRCCF